MTIFFNEWLNIDQYLEYLQDCDDDQITMYHQHSWLDAVSKGFDCKILYLRTFYKGKTLSLTPFMLKKKGPIVLLGSPLRGMFTEFCGPLFKKGLDAKIHESIMVSQHQFIFHGKQYIEWGLKGYSGPLKFQGKKLEELGYAFSQRPSLYIDLSSGQEEVWRQFKGRARNMVRKAEKAGLLAHTIRPSEIWISEYYDLLKNTFSRQGLSVPHPLSFYKQIETLSSQGLARCVEVMVEGKLAAGAVFLIDGSRMMYLSGVANKDGMRLAAPSLIQWHAIKEAIATEITEYDMGGLGVESIDKFKRSFGGSDIYHLRWVYRSNVFRLVEPIALWLTRKGVLRLGGS